MKLSEIILGLAGCLIFYFSGTIVNRYAYFVGIENYVDIKYIHYLGDYFIYTGHGALIRRHLLVALIGLILILATIIIVVARRNKEKILKRKNEKNS